MLKWLALFAALGLAPAQAQNFTMPPPAGVVVGGFKVVASCAAQSLSATQGFGTMDTTGALCVNAAVTISGGFTAASTGTPISVTTGGVSGTLPAGTVVVATNAGATNTAYCALGASATTSSQPISPNGGWFAFQVGSATQLTCITSTSTTTVNMVGGSGLPTGTGGGGGGSGSSGAVFGPTAGGTAAANPPVLMGGTVDGTTTGNVDNWKVASGIGYITGNLTQGGTALGATNGLYTNLLQANAVLATGNPIFVTGSGTAGSAATNPITVQGIASMTPVLTNPGTIATWGLVGIGGASNPTNALVAGCTYNSSVPSLSSGQSSGLQCNSSGELIVGNTNPNGQTTASASSPVVPPSDMVGNIPIANLVFGTTAAMTGTSSVNLLSAVTSKSLYVANISCVNSSSTGTFVTVQNGSSGTAIGTLTAAPSYGGDEQHNIIPLMSPTTAGTGLYVADVTTGANVICTASGWHN